MVLHRHTKISVHGCTFSKVVGYDCTKMFTIQFNFSTEISFLLIVNHAKKLYGAFIALVFQFSLPTIFYNLNNSSDMYKIFPFYYSTHIFPKYIFNSKRV